MADEYPRLFDIHSHVNDSAFDGEHDEVFQRLSESGGVTITVGTDIDMSTKACEIARKYDNSYACIGQHPVDRREESFDPRAYNALLNQCTKVVAIGECGLDYFRTDSDDIKEKKRQRGLFEAQIDFAAEHDLPLMLHIRGDEAHRDVLQVLREGKKHHGDLVRGNVHFFSESTDIARQFYDIGFSTSFTGVITFTDAYDEAVAYAPGDMIMSETDAPYVAPVPFRGKRNEPVYVERVVERIAQIRGGAPTDTAEMLVKNAYRIFNIA